MKHVIQVLIEGFPDRQLDLVEATVFYVCQVISRRETSITNGSGDDQRRIAHETRLGSCICLRYSVEERDYIVTSSFGRIAPSGHCSKLSAPILCLSCAERAIWRHRIDTVIYVHVHILVNQGALV